jgi:class 3 adenylate cyclase
MRVRHLFRRSRPFRYAGFWTLAAVWLGLLSAEASGRTRWQLALGLGFCTAWPWLADRWARLGPVDGPRLEFDMATLVAECLLVALVLGWCSLPPLATLATVICLLAGAAALAGVYLMLTALAAMAIGAWLGTGLAPHLTAASSLVADALAAALMVGFALALASTSFRQAQRLDAHRRSLADRSAILERLNGRMQRYLPPSLRARLADAPEAPCRWERRWLSVAFVDLVGFTELSERLEAEPLAAILDDYLGGLIDAADAHGGEVAKLLGDGVLVVFGARESGHRRERAGQALRFCRGVPALLAGLASQWRAQGELVTLRMRAGVASGYCTVGDRGGADRLDFTLVGSPVNLASRLQNQAEADDVLLDAATAALAESSFRLQAPRMVRLKGLGEVPAYTLGTGGGQVDPPAPSAILPPPAEPGSRGADGAVAEGFSPGVPR